MEVIAGRKNRPRSRFCIGSFWCKSSAVRKARPHCTGSTQKVKRVTFHSEVQNSGSVKTRSKFRRPTKRTGVGRGTSGWLVIAVQKDKRNGVIRNIARSRKAGAIIAISCQSRCLSRRFAGRRKAGVEVCCKVIVSSSSVILPR